MIAYWFVVLKRNVPLRVESLSRTVPQKKPNRGEIIAAGNGRITDGGDVRAMDVKVGDAVLFGQYAGTAVKVDGEELLMMKEEDILAVIEG